jgi:hypothetical protein
MYNESNLEFRFYTAALADLFTYVVVYYEERQNDSASIQSMASLIKRKGKKG